MYGYSYCVPVKISQKVVIQSKLEILIKILSVWSSLVVNSTHRDPGYKTHMDIGYKYNSRKAVAIINIGGGRVWIPIQVIPINLVSLFFNYIYFSSYTQSEIDTYWVTKSGFLIIEDNSELGMRV